MSGFSGFATLHALTDDAGADLGRMARRLEGATQLGAATNLLCSDRPPVRLACSFLEQEPGGFAWNAARDVGLVFVGEDFDLDVRAATPLSSGASGTSSDVERILHLYESAGPAFVSMLNGHFAGVVLDLRTDRLLLFNDRFGLNRVYVHASPQGLYFSTTAKSLLAVLPGTRRIDQRSLAEYFSVGCVLQNRSLFEGISILPPGSLWEIQGVGAVRKTSYFDPRTWENQEPLTASNYSEQLTDVFRRIAPKYLRGSARVGMSLTGGLDSRMILAWVRANPGDLPCYTFGGPYRDCADVRLARKLARVCHQPHTTLKFEPDFFRDFLQLAEKTIEVTDGAMDVSGAVELYMNRRARLIGPVRLTGNYGSEILRANVAFRPAKLDTTLFTPEFRTLLDEAADTYRREASCPRLTFIAFKQVPWHHFARYAAERSQLSPRSPFLDHELVALAYRCPRELEGNPRPLLDLITRGNPALDSVPTDRALHSNPSSVSWIKHRWHEFTAKAEYAYDYGMPWWLARTDAGLSPLHFEKLFLGRHKFYHFRIWYRDQLRSCLQSSEFRRELRWYEAGAPARLIEQHTSGRANRTLELHRLLSVQMIERSLADTTSCRN